MSQTHRMTFFPQRAVRCRHVASLRHATSRSSDERVTPGPSGPSAASRCSQAISHPTDTMDTPSLCAACVWLTHTSAETSRGAFDQRRITRGYRRRFASANVHLAPIADRVPNCEPGQIGAPANARIWQPRSARAQESAADSIGADRRRAHDRSRRRTSRFADNRSTQVRAFYRMRRG